MKYLAIKTSDICNGEGLRVSLWVSGCTRGCKGCHNPQSWDFNSGKEFTEETYKFLVKTLTTGVKRGLTITGGDPLDPKNYQDTLALCAQLKKDIPDLNIWVYTGLYYDELVELDQVDIFDYINTLVNGRFDLDLKDSSLEWRGSSNQRIFRF